MFWSFVYSITCFILRKYRQFSSLGKWFFCSYTHFFPGTISNYKQTQWINLYFSPWEMRYNKSCQEVFFWWLILNLFSPKYLLWFSIILSFLFQTTVVPDTPLIKLMVNWDCVFCQLFSLIPTKRILLMRFLCE